jgi:hypothetical protein
MSIRNTQASQVIATGRKPSMLESVFCAGAAAVVTVTFIHPSSFGLCRCLLKDSLFSL